MHRRWKRGPGACAAKPWGWEAQGAHAFLSEPENTWHLATCSQEKEDSKWSWQEVKSTRLVTLPGYQWKKWVSFLYIVSRPFWPFQVRYTLWATVLRAEEGKPSSRTPPLRPLCYNCAPPKFQVLPAPMKCVFNVELHVYVTTSEKIYVEN